MKRILWGTSRSLNGIRKTLILALVFFSLTNSISSQCLTVGDIGNFESNALSDNWWSGTQSNGTISLDATEAQSGSKSVKAEVTIASTWQMRLYNQHCTFNITSGESYRVTIYAKGTVGTKFDVALLNNATAESNQNITITSSAWEKYEVLLTCAATSSLGKIKVSFLDVGTYYIDNIYCEKISMAAASISDANICWEGVMESEITSGSELRLFRFQKNYATNDVVTYHTAERAASSAGIVMKLKSSSPSVNLGFAEDLTWAGDIFWHKIAVYKDDVYQFSTNDFDISLSNSTGGSVEWKLMMPTYTQINLKSIAIENGHTLESINCNSKPVYLAIGNSITMGVGLTENESRDSYSRVIADSLDYELYNWGIGGSKVHDTVYSNLTNSSLTPTLITVLWGYNDVHYSTSDDHFTNSTFPKYESLLSSILQNYPNACVMAILPTYTSDPTNTTTRTIPNLEAGQLNIITNLQLTYPKLDYMVGSAYTSAASLADVVHLNNSGNIALANGLIGELNCSIITGNYTKETDTGIKAFPNPTSGILNFNTPVMQLQLFNLLGVLLETKTNIKSIDLTQYQNGVYLLKADNQTIMIYKN